jgi:RNA polymerase sigma-70 factor (ECF subfamily)
MGYAGRTVKKPPPAASDAEGRDRKLMALAIRGQRKAFAELFERHAERLRRVAYLLLHDAGAAEDAVQETFTRGLFRIGSYRGEAKPDVWLYSICLNVARQMLRREGVREDLADASKLDRGRRPAGKPRGPLTSLMRRETSAHLSVALGFLTDLQREVFILHYIEGLPYEEIAPLLDVSVVGARGLAHRAKQVLRSKLPPNFSLPRGS